MTTDKDSRSKILYVLKVLCEETDEEHPISAKMIAERMNHYGFSCERKTIYYYIDALEQFGFDIVRVNSGVYLGTRLFETPELKLLIDAVKASRFISVQKSSGLINKLLLYTSNFDRQRLKGKMEINSVVKTVNENIYYNIDMIGEGICNDVKLTFHYLKWDGSGRLVPKNNGKRYVASPWCLMWENERYYMLAYDDSAQMIKHFRIDKMDGIECTDMKRNGREVFEKLDMTSYATENFDMFCGRDETVTLSVPKELAGAMIDHFGNNVWMHDNENGNLTVVVNVAVSNRFYGWLTGFGGSLRILQPEHIIEEYKQVLADCLNTCNK